MQTLAPVLTDRNPNHHTADEVAAVLRGDYGVRRFSFRYELLDKSNTYIQELTNVTSCKITENWLADIKRTATVGLTETGEIDFLSDRIKPYVRTWIPPYGPNDFVEHPQGVFLLSSNVRNSNEQNLVTRSVETYDCLQIFTDDKVLTRYTVAAGASYTGTISTLLGSVPKNVAPSTKTLPAAKEYDPGTSKLTIINDLLNAINYESLSFDEEGTAIVRAYRDPQTRAEEYQYGAGQSGLVIPNVDQELDIFDVPNSWLLVHSDPDTDTPIISSYTNSNPASLTSTVARGRTIVDYRDEQDAADQATLDAMVQRIAFDASQIYESISFSSALMPIHSGNDAYRIVYPSLAINTKYIEQSWELTLAAGQPMSHVARRVVSI